MMHDCEEGGRMFGYSGFQGHPPYGGSGSHVEHHQGGCCCCCRRHCCGGQGHGHGGMFGHFMSRRKKLEMLTEIKEALEEKLEAINEHIEELKKKSK